MKKQIKKKVILGFVAALLSITSLKAQPTQFWTLGGNQVWQQSFFGTSNFAPLRFKTNGLQRVIIMPHNGFVGMGINDPKNPLHIHANDKRREYGDYQCTGNDEMPCPELPITDDGEVEADVCSRSLSGGTHRANFHEAGTTRGKDNDEEYEELESYSALQITNCKTGDEPTNGLLLSMENRTAYLRQLEEANFNISMRDRDAITVTPDLNVGIGTTIPRQKLHVVDGNILISRTSTRAPGSTNGSLLFGANMHSQCNYGEWGIEYLNDPDPEAGFGLNFWKPWDCGTGGFNHALFLHDNGNIGIGMNNPQRKLDVNGDFAAKGTFVLSEESLGGSLSLGSIPWSQNLGWGTSYIGFNAIRNNSTETWKCEGDGSSNGGGVIYANLFGDICFSAIPSTHGNTKILSDNQIRQNIKLLLTSDGILKAKEVLVSLSNWPDFVFEKDYSLKSLQETEQFIKQNKHLPDIPSAQEVEENGIKLGEMQGKLLQKIEELTLHIIELEKRLAELENKKGGE